MITSKKVGGYVSLTKANEYAWIYLASVNFWSTIPNIALC